MRNAKLGKKLNVVGAAIIGMTIVFLPMSWKATTFFMIGLILMIVGEVLGAHTIGKSGDYRKHLYRPEGNFTPNVRGNFISQPYRSEDDESRKAHMEIEESANHQMSEMFQRVDEFNTFQSISNREF